MTRIDLSTREWHELVRPDKMLAESAWRDELAEVPWLAEASGIDADAKRPEHVVDVDPATVPDGPPPWITAAFKGACTGCEARIVPGDEIQADGSGGWLCGDCGTGPGDDDEPDGVVRVG